ncbi:ribonuclease HII [Candidatus Leptofilum sp.]|uniref:ribonuclease HII n=1 Tax=Candidatus Leptofilum sp. TaxID=3241576 RepID=UPI003B58E28B
MANLALETAVSQQHQVTHIAGIDEAGRGALAGPVVATAVILPLNNQIETLLREVNDSKTLSAKKREALYLRITQHAITFGIGQQPASVIDEIGILPANRLAMATAVAQLTPAPQFLLIDGRIRLPHLNIPQKSIVRGDGKSLSIAAASILAKVTRDRLMVELDSQFPHYGFAQHKGYGTQQHRDALKKHGPCLRHRYSFAPIRKPLI